MVNRRFLSISLACALGCAPRFVANQPRTVLLQNTYDLAAVRGAIARAIHHRKLTTESEAEAAVVVATPKSPRCRYEINYSDHGLVVAMTGPGPAAGSPAIDERCVDEAKGLVKAVEKEVQRPAREAARAIEAERRHEMAVARERELAAQAELAAEQAAQQPPAPPYVVASPDPPTPIVTNNTVNLQSNHTSSSTVNNTTNTTTIVRQVAPAPAPQPSQPALERYLCCRDGQPRVCPNLPAYTAACVRQPSQLAALCPVDSGQARYCH
jgi:hypothetical protein